MARRVLVTGGAGMIGSNLVKALVANDTGEVFVADNLWRGSLENLFDNDGKPFIPIETHFLELDLRDATSCLRACQGIDDVYHLAGVVAGIGFVFSNQRLVFQDNTLIDTNLLNAAADSGVRRLVYVGTACSYPRGKQFGVDAPPLTEDEMYPADPESAYGWSKLVGELQTTIIGQETELETGIMRLYNVYGAPCEYSAKRGQVVPSLIRKAIRHPEEEFLVWGSGKQGRSFIHVQDVVRGLILMMEQGLGPDPVQLGTDRCTTIREIAEMIVEISGKPINIVYDRSKPEGDQGRCADCTRALRRLGWRPEVSLKQGLITTYRWVESRM